MFFLQGTVPDTSAYLVMGYVVIFGALLLHLASLALRKRNLQRDIELLEDLTKDE